MSEWNRRCEEALRRERKEVEARYGIRIGKTEIYCARCGKSWGFGSHVCQDVRLASLRVEKEKKLSGLMESENKGLLILGDLGPQKAAILLMLPDSTVTKWIQRKSIPKKHMDKVLNLQRCPQG